ncbi:unnamed protein product, partial [Urochloa humidicola]
ALLSPPSRAAAAAAAPSVCGISQPELEPTGDRCFPSLAVPVVLLRRGSGPLWICGSP